MAAVKVGKDILVQTSLNGVRTLRFNNPKKLNSWSAPMMREMQSAFSDASKDPATKAIIVTGTGNYYSAGVDLAGVMKPMAPAKLVSTITTYNQDLFELFIKFEKPIIIAVNGPAIGAPVTSASICDTILASNTATFHTPFAALGLPAEGCSSYWFPRQLGDEMANKLLNEAVKIDAETALSCGLVHRVVEPDQLMEEAQKAAEEWVASGKPRKIIAEDQVEKLIEVNARESVDLANGFVSVKFLEAQREMASKKGRTQQALLFSALKLTRPVWASFL